MLRGLRRRSAAARRLRSWVRIPPGAWMFVCCEFCVLSGRGLCDELITRPEESYRLWCVVVCDLKNLVNEESMTRFGSQRHRKKKNYLNPGFTIRCGPGSVVVIATGYGLDGPVIESRWGARFSAPLQTGHGGPPSLLYNGYRVFSRGQRAAGA